MQRTLVLGVVNVTPDSFSDGGQWLDPDVAIAHGRHLAAQGADLVDIGGESTRPGATRVDPAQEAERVLPVVATLAAEGIRVSIDTMNASTAALALDAGATVVNDVSGGLSDPAMADLIAERDCTFVLGHWRGHSDVMSTLTRYGDVVSDVAAELTARLDVFADAGVAPERVVLDPGLGFAKDADANWTLLAHVDALLALGQRVMIGASRKRFLGELLASYGSEALPPFRDRATAAVSALMAARGVWGLRVHDVVATVDAVRVAQAIREAGAAGRPGNREAR